MYMNMKETLFKYTYIYISNAIQKHFGLLHQSGGAPSFFLAYNLELLNLRRVSTFSQSDAHTFFE